jgi:hypothetical protein
MSSDSDTKLNHSAPDHKQSLLAEFQVTIIQADTLSTSALAYQWHPNEFNYQLAQKRNQIFFE